MVRRTSRARVAKSFHIKPALLDKWIAKGAPKSKRFEVEVRFRRHDTQWNAIRLKNHWSADTTPETRDEAKRLVASALASGRSPESIYQPISATFDDAELEEGDFLYKQIADETGESDSWVYTLFMSPGKWGITI